MKKIFFRIVLCIFCVSFLAVIFGCDGCNVDFEKTTLTNWGNVQKNYGFISTTDNYVYFINGIGDSSEDNTFGRPVKGSLMVAEKNNLSAPQIAVPKLFVASDYNSGIFLAGQGDETYVYYGSPNIEKNAKGDIANSELNFMRTRLDGSKDEIFVTVSALDVQYRFVNNNDKIYLVYYENSEVKEYDINEKKSQVVVKTDIEENESLDNIIFTKDINSNGFTAIYTVKCYKGDFTTEENRMEQPYNKVYAYRAGEEPICILDGSKKIETYCIDLFANGYLFYGITEESGDTEIPYVMNLSDDAKESKKVINKDYVADTTLIVDLDTIYVKDTDNKVIYRTSFVDNEKNVKEVVANASAEKLLAIEDENIYYSTEDNKIARIKLEDEEAKEVIVINEEVSSSWYSSVIIDNKLFCIVKNYVNYIALDNEEQESESEEEDKIITLGESVFIGKRTSGDEADLFTDIISEISIFKDGKPIKSDIDRVQAIYDDLSEEAKEISEVLGNTAKFENYKKAYELSEKFYKLDKIVGYDRLSDEEKAELKSSYEEAKQAVESLEDEKAIIDLIDNNLNWNYYNKGKEVFESSDESE